MTGNMFEMDAIGATVLGYRAGRRPRPGDRVNYRRLRHRLPCRRHGDDGVSDFWQMVIKGVVIVTAVVVDQFQQKLQSKVILMRRHEEKLAAIPQRRHLQLTGNDSHLPPGPCPLSEREKYATRFPEQNGGDHRRLPRHRRRHCRALCPRRRESRWSPTPSAFTRPPKPCVSAIRRIFYRCRSMSPMKPVFRGYRSRPPRASAPSTSPFRTPG